MADTGFLSPGTLADDSAVGTDAWANPTNAASSNDVRAIASPTVSGSVFTVRDVNVKLVKGGTVSGDNKADTGTDWPSSDTDKTYGGAADLWGVTLTESDVEASDFGVVINAQFVEIAEQSHYLKATNFSASIPAGATIDGVEVVVERRKTDSIGSFIGGTMVRTITGLVPIEKIKIGDQLVTFQNDRVVTGTVVAVRNRIATGLVTLRAGNNLVTATPEHKFYVGNGKFVPITGLRIGQSLYIYNPTTGQISKDTLTEIYWRGSQKSPVFNLSITPTQTFLANDIAVHNFIVISTTTMEIDHMKLKIYYTEAAATRRVFVVS